ncbi:MAG: hypothetical protein IIB82_15910 [Bacteroidetes bacterium]|nr:hypothetical protein [Bacteroidota bacterium]
MKEFIAGQNTFSCAYLVHTMPGIKIRMKPKSLHTAVRNLTSKSEKENKNGENAIPNHIRLMNTDAISGFP